MFFRVMTLLAGLASGNASAMVFPLEVIEYIDNNKVVAFINEADINKSPAWQPQDGAPPLALNDALKLVNQHAKADMHLNDVSLTDIELKKIPQHEKHWHYLVEMNASANEKKQTYYFIGLMDGKIISGIREPQSIK